MRACACAPARDIQDGLFKIADTAFRDWLHVSALVVVLPRATLFLAFTPHEAPPMRIGVPKEIKVHE
ncbi:MAG TPA: hypothetical protein DHK64_16440, partial [Rhodobiaceae bacterium]|nr:hypothetical protein [Rhodobiaceae bacterium]